MKKIIYYLKKLVYYRNLFLIVRIIYFQWKFTYINNVLSISEVNEQGRRKYEFEKLKKYVGFATRVGRRFGLKKTCLSDSLILYRLARENGYDVRLNFGCLSSIDKKTDKVNILGHSWVSNAEANVVEKDNYYEVIFQLPGGKEHEIQNF